MVPKTDILADVKAAFDLIKSSTGLLPNYIILSGKVLFQLRPDLDIDPESTYEIYKNIDGSYTLGLVAWGSGDLNYE